VTISKLSWQRVACLGAGLAFASCADVSHRRDTAADERATTQLIQEQFAPALRLARASRANGDLTSAINLYRSVTSIKPADPAVVVELGDTLVDAGLFDDAIHIYQQVPRNSSAAASALLGLEQAYLTLGSPAEALRYAAEARLAAPNDSRVMIGQGVALDMLARHSEAQPLYRAVLALTPHNVAARNNLALSLAMTQQYDEAIQIMMPMAKSANATPRIRQNLALIYGLAGDAPRAAVLSRMDLDAATTEANLHFFELARAAR